MENLVVTGQALGERLDATLFQEIISRDGAPARAVLERTRHMMAFGGRWYLPRTKFDAAELAGLPVERAQGDIEMAISKTVGLGLAAEGAGGWRFGHDFMLNAWVQEQAGDIKAHGCRGRRSDNPLQQSAT